MKSRNKYCRESHFKIYFALQTERNPPSAQSFKMSGDERPQKMRKLSRDHEESRAEVETAKNVPDATNGNGEVQHTAGDENVTQKSAPSAPAAALPTDAVRGDGTLATNAQDPPPMSKNQLKKLRKKQEWEAGREERKVISTLR